MSDVPAAPASNDESLKVTALIGYGLFLLALVNGVTAIVGVVLAYVMRGNARGTVWENHFTNLIHVFWISAVMAVIVVTIVVEGFGGMFYALASNHDPAPALTGLLFLLVPLLFLIGVVFGVWFLYRMIRGTIRALESKAY